VTKHAVVAELYYSGAWHDVTAAEELYTDIVVSTSRYAASLTRKFDPGTTNLSLKNTSGKYNPENPMSSLYGLTSLAMPMRVSVDSDVRWTGEASEWRPRRETSGPMRMTLTGGGILRRLGLGSQPVFSALKSTMMSLDPIAYWPLTDGPQTDIGGSSSAGEPGFPLIGSMEFSKVTGPYGARELLPEMVQDVSTGVPALTTIVSGDSTSNWTMDFVINATKPDGATSWSYTAFIWSDENNSWIFDVYGDSTTSNYLVELVAYDADASISLQVPINIVDGQWHHIRIDSENYVGSMYASITVDGSEYLSGSSASMTSARIEQITLLNCSSTYMKSASVGHVAVYQGVSIDDTSDASFGYPGELAADRFVRVAAENGVTATVVGTVATDSKPMGPQPSGTLLDVLYDCVVTDGGLAYESSGGELTMRCLGSMYRQAAALVIDVDTDIPQLEPLIGDRTVRNDVTANRKLGSSTRRELASGAMSVQAPPLGVGRHPAQVDVNPSTDAVLGDYASWLVALSTVGGVQYAKIIVDLDANTGIDVTGVEIGDVVQLDGVPAYDDPETPRLVIVGMEETINTHRRTLTLLTVSAKPYDVGLLGTAGQAGFLDCDATTINEDLNATETGIDILITDACAWTYASGNYDILIGGERMTVTAVSAVSGSVPSRTQTLYVTRSVNGVVKTHATGAEVHVADPFILAL